MRLFRIEHSVKGVQRMQEGGGMGDPEKNWFTQKLEFYFFGEKKEIFLTEKRGPIREYACSTTE